MSSVRVAAVLQALLVTFLWSTSWVLISFGLEELPPLLFAGLRYALAFLCLLPVLLAGAESRAALSGLSPREWAALGALGVLLYAVTQGAQFVGLAYLPAVTVSLLLNFTPVVVAALAGPLLRERPTPLQLAGVALYLAGAVLYFSAEVSFAGQLIGLIVVVFGVFGNAGGSLLGRGINREGRLPPLLVTTVSMGIGSTLLLLSGLAVHGAPQPLTGSGWAILLWLAVVNTAFAFTLWNRTLRVLSALESSVINNTMLVQVAALAWLFLGQSLGARELLGVVAVAAGILLVQVAPALPRRGK